MEENCARSQQRRSLANSPFCVKIFSSLVADRNLFDVKKSEAETTVRGFVKAKNPRGNLRLLEVDSGDQQITGLLDTSKALHF